jgi:hypothetical protein
MKFYAKPDNGAPEVFAAFRDARKHIEKSGGPGVIFRLTERRRVGANLAVVAADPVVIDEPQAAPSVDDDDAESVDIDALKLLAAGDKRKSETREAIAKLAELGIE